MLNNTNNTKRTGSQGAPQRTSSWASHPIQSTTRPEQETRVHTRWGQRTLPTASPCTSHRCLHTTPEKREAGAKLKRKTRHGKVELAFVNITTHTYIHAYTHNLRREHVCVPQQSQPGCANSNKGPCPLLQHPSWSILAPVRDVHGEGRFPLPMMPAMAPLNRLLLPEPTAQPGGGPSRSEKKTNEMQWRTYPSTERNKTISLYSSTAQLL